jgi:tetratricopeptide (TPR) repeat protein
MVKVLKINRLILALVCLVVLLAISGIATAQQETNPHQPTTMGKLTAEQWRDDLRFFAAEMPKAHRNLFHTMSREQFDAAVKKLDERIPALADHEIVVEFMRIVAMIGDGHTGVRIDQKFNSGLYPLRLYLYKDGLFVQAAAPEYREAVGARVVKIGSIPVEQALRAVAEISWHDNELGIKSLAPRLLVIPEILHALRLSGDLRKAEFVVEKDGRQTKLEVTPSGRFQHQRQVPSGWVDARAEAKAPTPLWLKDPDNNFWFEHLKGPGILYVQFNAVQDKPEVDHKPGETVAAFFNRVFEYVEANQVDKLVLDLRLNGGGNNFLNLPLTIGMIKSRVNKRDKLFVITGRETFSAAQNTVNELEKYTNAIFVGEPTAATPNHFGDARNLMLPNSKLVVRASTLWWQDADPRDRRKWKAPEIAAELTSADYRANVDPAMAAILSYVPGKSLTEILTEALKAGDLAGMVKQYRIYREDPAHAYLETESAVNTLGYGLINQNRVDDAIEIFKLNVEAYPSSANVYDSLAEAYLRKGNKELAIKFYTKAVEVDPNFASSIEALRQLKAN